MGWFKEILLLPVAPVRGVIKLGEILQRQANQELHNPARTRRQLEELEERRAQGEISAEEEKKAQEAILATMIAPTPVMPPSDKVRSAQAQNMAGDERRGGRRRATARKSTPRRSSSARRRSGHSG
jgi:hypothetical protein